MRTEHYLVMREKDAQDGTGSIHVDRFPQEGMARARAAEKARSKPGVRYVVYKLVDGCEAHVSPAEWDAHPEEGDADG